MSLVKGRVVSNTLNVLMPDWMQNSHAAITGQERGRGVTWDASWTMCPRHKGQGQWGKALHSTQTRTTPHPLMGVCYSLDRQTGNGIPQKWPPATAGGKALCCKWLSPVPWCLNHAGQQHCPCLQGFSLGCHCPLCAADQGSTAAWWAVPPPLKGRNSTCSLPILTEAGRLAGPGTATLNLCVNARITPKHLRDPCRIHNWKKVFLSSRYRQNKTWPILIHFIRSFSVEYAE